MCRLFLLAAILGVLMASVCLASDDVTASERVQKRFNSWLQTSETKRGMVYPNGWGKSLCKNKGDCCDGAKCAAGSKCDADTSKDNAASKFGYVCTGDKCGPKAGKNVGVLCDVPYEEACKACEKKHGKYFQCIPSTVTVPGYLCYKKANGDWLIQDRRDLDHTFGYGAADALELFGREEIEKDMPAADDKKTVLQMLKELLGE